MIHLPIDPVIHLVASGFIIIVLARAAIEKAFDFGIFTAIMRDYGLLPARLIAPAAVMLLAGEVIAIACLIAPGFAAAGALFAGGLFAVYGVAIGVALLSGRTEIECGCGGEGQMISWALVVRNVVLIMISGLCSLGVADRPLAWPDFVVGLLAILVAFLLLSIAEKTIATSAAIKRLNSNL
jgi:hypothetical protein